jgi:hypothetical protein
LATVCRQNVDGGNQQTASVCTSNVEGGSQIIFGEQKNSRGWQPKNCVRVKKKCPVWQQKIPSMCRRSAEGGIKISSLLCTRCIQGGSQKIAPVCRQIVDGDIQNSASVCSRIGQGVNQIWRKCAGELSREAPKNGGSVPENSP